MTYDDLIIGCLMLRNNVIAACWIARLWLAELIVSIRAACD